MRIRIEAPPADHARLHDCMEFKRHHGQEVELLKDCGQKLLIRGDGQGPREYDWVPESWRTISHP